MAWLQFKFFFNVDVTFYCVNLTLQNEVYLYIDFWNGIVFCIQLNGEVKNSLLEHCKTINKKL
jgi:hypothetical protein